MALSTQPKVSTNGILRVIAGAVTRTVNTEEGDIKIAGLGRRLNAALHVTRRGRLMGAALGARRFPVVTVNEKILSAIAAAAPGPLRDFLTGTGAYSANVGTLGAGQNYTVDFELTLKDNTGVTPDDVIYLNDVDFNSYDFAEGEPDTFAFTGMVLGPVTINGVEIAREINEGGS
jgi:hypothetical protein